MAIITLTTDHGKQDHYTASVKGKILSSGVSDLQIVDISHSIKPFDVFEAAYVLKNTYQHFPEGTIHLVSVNDGLTEQAEHVLMLLNGQYFLSADNGIFSIISEGESNVTHYGLKTKITEEALVFPLRERLVEAACHLARGGTPEIIGNPKAEILHAEMYKPLLEPDVIRGHVVYVDGYENAITNITKQTFRDIGKGREFNIRLVKSKETIRKITESYGQTKPGRALALFGCEGNLEIAMAKAAPRSGGGAKSLLGLRVNDIVRIEFE